MPENKRSFETKTNSKPTQIPAFRDDQLERLRTEIDKLALLVSEAKRQSDKIQAAADALGDTLLGYADDRSVRITPLLRQSERLR